MNEKFIPHDRGIAGEVNRGGQYHRSARTLHWLMAIGFVLMWATGVFVTNVEGVPYWIENDRQGIVRDIHKSIGLTLLALLLVRIGLRFMHRPPELPRMIPSPDRRMAHIGHLAIYLTIVMACISGYAIADLHEYGNAYFGIDLPQIFPAMERVAGWASTPWAYVLHAIVSYGLLLLIIGHVAFVVIHKYRHGADLLPRMTAATEERSEPVLSRLVMIVAAITLVIAFFAVRGFVTLGPQEEPRDYITTTPF
jgi:cytochrome b561